MKLFDAHCHLQDEKLLPQIDAAIARAKLAGVQKLYCCGTSEADWGLVRQLAGQYTEIVPAFGLHPWYVKERTSNWESVLLDFLRASPAAGVGEIGLDRAIEDSDADAQAEVFLAQLRIAKVLKRPVSIHCRRAWDTMQDLLKSVGVLPAGFVVHSYSGPAELVKQLAEMGAYFSFSGSITFSGNKKGHKAAQAVPIDRLLIETDAPDLIPAALRAADVPNEPANIVHVLRKVAELRDMPEPELAELTWLNAERLFQKW
jgi:TatD DNase family protein